MAWDSSKPTDTEKIRDLGVVIRPNWISLEQGEDANAMVNSNSGAWIQQYSLALIERDGRAANDNPGTEAETFFTYCKQDANAIAEGYVKDPAGNIVQFTQGGRLGSATTNATVQNLRFGTATTDYNATMLPRAWGVIQSGGASFTINKNFDSVSFVSLGLYRVDITGLGYASGNDYAVFVTANGGNRFGSYLSKTATSFDVICSDDTGTRKTVEMTVMLMEA